LHRSHENIARARRSSFSEATGQKGQISEILASERVDNTKKSINRQKNLDAHNYGNQSQGKAGRRLRLFGGAGGQNAKKQPAGMSAVSIKMLSL
jgi:hypothetical protein